MQGCRGTYNAAIGASGKSSQWQRAVALFDEMAAKAQGEETYISKRSLAITHTAPRSAHVDEGNYHDQKCSCPLLPKHFPAAGCSRLVSAAFLHSFIEFAWCGLVSAGLGCLSSMFSYDSKGNWPSPEFKGTNFQTNYFAKYHPNQIDVPEAVQTAAKRHGWQHFGRLGASLIAGPNKWLA